MKAMFITATLFVAGIANANTISFACRGRTNDGAIVDLSGMYELNGSTYRMLGDLSVSGTDGGGNSLFSSGGSSGTDRYFAEENVRMRSDGEFFNLTAKSSNGSILKIRHREGSDRDDYVLVDLQPTRTKDAYYHEFNRAKCRFN